MVETTPLGKWSGRGRTNLRLVLSSPRDKVNMKASVSLREGGAMLEVKVEKCAGIDVGKKFLAVCILIGLANQKPVGEVRRFGTSVKELERLRTWLLESGCTEAVMESTGSYWKPVFNILEGSLKIILANPEQVKALRGKKTDPNDSRWLASLLRHGLVQGSFIPPRDIRELRDLTRRAAHVGGRGSGGTEPCSEDSGRCQRQDRQCAVGRVWDFRSEDAGSLIGKQTERCRNRPTWTLELGTKDSADHRSGGGTSNDRSSPLHDPSISAAHARHRRDDRGIG